MQDVIDRAMKDNQGNYKGYFTYQELAFRLLLKENAGWTYEKMDKALAQWKQEGKLIETEPGKYKPNPNHQQHHQQQPGKELSTGESN